MAQTNVSLKQKQTHRHRKRTYFLFLGGRRGRNKSGVWDLQMLTVTSILKISKFSVERLRNVPETAQLVTQASGLESSLSTIPVCYT